MSGDASTQPRPHRAIHPSIVRLTHWINAAALIAMVMSGWQIYNASPIFDFRFPVSITLGGWLAGAIAWHFAAMWVLAVNLLVYLAYGLFSGHFRRDLLPITPAGVWRDVRAAFAFRLPHRPGRYNAVQRLLYAGVIMLIMLAIVSGLAIWKPVQFQTLAWLMGGYDIARVVHFFAMAGIVGFFVVHILLVLIVPKTLPPMIVGGRIEDAETNP
ncbi:cytochrome b/b6 domain-containing protein [Emcibacter sp. SYSU 3D8]|uniref:cytochrome b/b6 domain-containing protein n=1 Tax=Emcibacter sp. SYSU 3D8 TaxID=3133969 RepID=UPI0031FEA1F6